MLAIKHSLKRIVFPKPTVFLCSTFLEFELERRAISRELANDYSVVMMESESVQEPAGESREMMILEWIQDKIRNCEIVLVLIGKGSGSHFYAAGTPYTQIEIDAALKLGKRMVVYRLHKPFPDADLLNPDSHWTEEYIRSLVKSSWEQIPVLDKPLNVPYALDIHSAGEMLQRLRKDLGTQAVTVQTSRLLAYVIVGWLVFAFTVFILIRLLSISR
jgi:hypothetical protein